MVSVKAAIDTHILDPNLLQQVGSFMVLACDWLSRVVRMHPNTLELSPRSSLNEYDIIFICICIF